MYKYLNELKRLGVYDSSTIIIAGDHGKPTEETKEFISSHDEGTATCVFVKPKNSNNETLKTSHKEISVSNIIPTIVEDTNLVTNNDYGTSINDIADNETVEREYYQSVYSSKERKLGFNKYKITGDAKNLDNWKLEKEIRTEINWY